MCAAIASSAFIIYRHRANIARIRAGTEHAISFGSRKTDPSPGWRARRP